MLQIRTRFRSAASLAIEGVALLASSSGAAVAVVFGKVLLAVALGAIALGVFLRFTSRQRRALPVERRAPTWVSPVIALATIVECAALVEAVDLPVRLSQPGFQYDHWLFVGVFLLLAYGLQSKLVRKILPKPERRSTP